MTLKFSRDHEWIDTADQQAATVGITVHAQDALGDVAGVIESVKAAADVYMPLSGTIVEVNQALRADPALANSDPMGAGWLFKVCISKPEECAALMDAPAYDAFSQNA